MIVFLLFFALYFIIGFIWASCVVYFDWKYPDRYTEFWFSFLVWWMDIIRKISCGLRDLGDSYEGLLCQLRNKRWLSQNKTPK